MRLPAMRATSDIPFESAFYTLETEAFVAIETHMRVHGIGLAKRAAIELQQILVFSDGNDPPVLGETLKYCVSNEVVTLQPANEQELRFVD